VRIIAGKAGRMAIKVPSAVARPTTDFVRQAIYSILGETIFDARVLDLFCGSGALGLEALSRGAASCVFVDEHRQAIAVTDENLKKPNSMADGRSKPMFFLSFNAMSLPTISSSPILPIGKAMAIQILLRNFWRYLTFMNASLPKGT